jgi:XTP/dITP diphosphohydrolase
VTPRRILLASENPAKQHELRRLLEGLPARTVTPAEAGIAAPRLEENGATHLENALLKAAAWAAASGLPALASDGGLHIPALGDAWDGLRNRRFAGPADDDRIAALLSLMHGLPPARRTAVFREAVALVVPEGTVIASAEAISPEGRIAEAPDARRHEGFWVTSLWLHPPRWVTEFDLTSPERASRETAWDRVSARIRRDVESWLAPSLPSNRGAW